MDQVEQTADLPFEPFSNLPRAKIDLVRHQLSNDFVALAQFINDELNSTFPNKFDVVGHDASCGWHLPKGHPLIKLCNYKESMAFGLREAWATNFPSLVASDCWQRRFTVPPNRYTMFVGFAVANDEESRSLIKGVIEMMLRDASAAAGRSQTG